MMQRFGSLNRNLFPTWVILHKKKKMAYLYHAFVADDF